MAKMSIHHLIRTARKRLEMTEQAFADAVGVTRGAVQQWEKPDGTAPARKHQQAVADLIGITVGELMSGASEKYPTDPPAQLKVTESPPETELGLLAEARGLLQSMSPNGQREAINYLRYLATRHPADFSADAADGPGASISGRPKAA